MAHSWRNVKQKRVFISIRMCEKKQGKNVENKEVRQLKGG